LEDLPTNDFEMIFLIELVKRKCKPILVTQNLYNMKREDMVDLFNILRTYPSQKRFEENMKFIYKIVIKKLKEKFMIKN
jgi:hypothetical protein